MGKVDDLMEEMDVVLRNVHQSGVAPLLEENISLSLFYKMLVTRIEMKIDEENRSTLMFFSHSIMRLHDYAFINVTKKKLFSRGTFTTEIAVGGLYDEFQAAHRNDINCKMGSFIIKEVDDIFNSFKEE